MFYSLKEAAEKLNITEEQVQKLVSEGKLREFRDGANVLVKVDEVEALKSDMGVAASKEESPAGPEQAAGTGEISLAPEATGDTAAVDDLTDEDTVVAGEEVDVVGEADSESQRTDGMMAEAEGTTGEPSLEEIEEDVNLDTFGSGSGLLDLSLQADDTSLGGILDEIYTAEGNQDTSEGSALELAAEAEAEPMVPEEDEFAAPEVIPEVPAMSPAYVEPAPDTLSNAFGIMLVLPLLAIVYTAIVAMGGFNNVMPAILGKIQGISGPYGIHIIWYIAAGVAAVAGLIVGGAFMLSGGGAKAGGKPKARIPKRSKRTKAKP
jgi:excisionase family DNA binding protein